VRNGLTVWNAAPFVLEDQARKARRCAAPGLAGMCAGWESASAPAPTGPGRLSTVWVSLLSELCLQSLEQLDGRFKPTYAGSSVDRRRGGSPYAGETVSIVGSFWPAHQDEDRLRVQRNWLLGMHSKRSALVLQFSAAGQPFSESLLRALRWR